MSFDCFVGINEFDASFDIPWQLVDMRDGFEDWFEFVDELSLPTEEDFGGNDSCDAGFNGSNVVWGGYSFGR